MTDWRGPAAVERQRGCYIRTITTSVHLENTITFREAQGTWRQDELIGGKPPVLK
jgi:hypothetical protein